MENKKYKKNEVIFREGESGDCMFDIMSGSVGIYADWEKPEQKLLVTLPAEAVFGEMGMIEHEPRSATAVALEPSTIKVISEAEFQNYLTEKPGTIMAILQHTSGRVRRLSKEYVEACDVLDAYTRAEETGAEKSPELMARMKEIVRRGRK